jgi:hypothetical protein
LVGPQRLNVSLGSHQSGLHLGSFIFGQSYLSLGADHFDSLGLQSSLQVAKFILQLARLLLNTEHFMRIDILKLTKQQKYQQVLFQTISLSLGVVQLPQQMLFAVIT